MKERHTIIKKNKANKTNPVFFMLGITLLLSSCATVFETDTQPQTKPVKIISQPTLENTNVSPSMSAKQINIEPSLEPSTKNPIKSDTQQPSEIASKAFPEEALY